MQPDEARQFLVYRVPCLKGVSILAVVAMHVTGDLVNIPHYSWLTGVLLFATTAAKFAVPLFVLLSGFYLGLNPRNERAFPFYRRTLKFLVVPYLVYSVVYSVPAVAAGRSVGEAARTLLTASASAHLWFAPMIIELYLLHPFLARWYRTFTCGEVFVLAALLVQLYGWPEIKSLVAPLSGVPGQFLYLSLWFLSHVGYFVAGYYVLEHSAQVVRLVNRPRAVHVGLAVFLSVTAAIAAYAAIPMSRGAAFSAALTPPPALKFLWVVLVGSAAATIAALGRKKPAGALLNAFGLYAYGIYYLHPVFVSLLSRALKRIAGLGPENAAWYVLLFGLTCVLTLAGVRLLARMPFGRYLT